MDLRPDADLIVHSRTPLNAEPPLKRLRASFLTAADDFYIRTHGEVPDISPNEYRLSVGGGVAKPLDLSLDDLGSGFPRARVTATMQCAGNRRADLAAVAPVSGDPWAPGAIGTAEWQGVALAEVLRAAGLRSMAGVHVAFEGFDEGETRDGWSAFGASIPVEKALGPEVLLADTMNGAPLRPVHGAPLRLVVPGYAGVRSVKWLKSITVQAEPSRNFHQAKDYKLFPPNVSAKTADPDKGMTIYEMPLNSAICEPADGAALTPGPTRLRGYAVCGGRPIARVDVSADGGRHWRQAELEEHGAGRGAQAWAWTFWNAVIDLPEGPHELVVRAVDIAGQTQPADPADVWNHKGYLSAAWHRVRVNVG